ncbi:MAG: 4Fe-4S dicluster domain-containing protein [Deltaproteobacteria bacterium]|nr:4Fe-4S dicluster domain-containing protein [Deltaproteobacteria bacterium]
MSAVETYRSLRFNHDRCIGCMTCMRACTARSIRMKKGYPLVIQEKCIDCGECIRSCRENAITSRTPQVVDLARFEKIVAIPSSPLLVQFQPDVGPSDVAEALRRLGFDEVVSLEQACLAYLYSLAELVLSRRFEGPLITSHCPTVTRLIQTLYPDLLGNLVPRGPPRELAARWVRERLVRQTGLAPDRIGIVYISPCPSKIVDTMIHESPDGGAMHAVLPINEIYHEVLTALSHMRLRGELTREGSSSADLGWAFLGGMSRNLRRMVYALDSRSGRGRKRKADHTDYLPVAQLPSVRRVLDEIEKGRLQHVDLVECMACPEGCVGGSLVVDNPYPARSKAIEYLRKLPPPEERADFPSLRTIARSGELQRKHDLVASPLPPLDSDFRRSLLLAREKEELLSSLPGIDCGACGAPTCAELADDVVRSLASVGDCLVLAARGTRTARKENTMKLAEVASSLSLSPVSGRQHLDVEVAGCYVSDLLSDVIAHAADGILWITLQTHLNVVAVAKLNNLAGIVLVNGRQPAADTLAKAEEEGLPLLTTALTAYQVAGRLYELGVGK